MNKKIFLFVSVLIYVSFSKAEAQSYDVVVYGATASGVTAAVAASKEGATVFNESWAGRHPITFTSHQIDTRINPFNNDKEKKLLPLIHPKPMVEIGEGDKGIQTIFVQTG